MMMLMKTCMIIYVSGRGKKGCILCQSEEQNDVQFKGLSGVGQMDRLLKSNLKDDYDKMTDGPVGHFAFSVLSLSLRGGG
jgi:hypothetical protein